MLEKEASNLSKYLDIYTSSFVFWLFTGSLQYAVTLFNLAFSQREKEMLQMEVKSYFGTLLSL